MSEVTIEPPKVDKFLELCREIAEFMMANDKERCFPRHIWDLPKATNFIHYHFNRKTILFVRDKGEIVGAAVWWKWKKDDLDLNADFAFDEFIPESDPDGDLYYHSDMVTTDNRASGSMVEIFKKRNPDWEKCEHWMTRLNKKTGKTKRVQYTKNFLKFVGRMRK